MKAIEWPLKRAMQVGRSQEHVQSYCSISSQFTLLSFHRHSLPLKRYSSLGWEQILYGKTQTRLDIQSFTSHGSKVTFCFGESEYVNQLSYVLIGTEGQSNQLQHIKQCCCGVVLYMTPCTMEGHRWKSSTVISVMLLCLRC